MKYTLDRYRSICSAIKCPFEITTDDYFVASNGAGYDAIQADNGLITHFMPTKYYHFACFSLSTYLFVLFVNVSVCAIVQLEIYSPENTNKITDERALACSTFHFYFQL